MNNEAFSSMAATIGAGRPYNRYEPTPTRKKFHRKETTYAVKTSNAFIFPCFNETVYWSIESSGGIENLRL